MSGTETIDADITLSIDEINNMSIEDADEGEGE